MIVCGRVVASPDDPDAVINPTVLVEVVSDSSEAYDRGEKFAHYRRIPSLRDYVLVSQKSPRLEVYSREGDRWVFTEAVSGGAVQLPSVGVSLRVDDVYRDPTAAP